MATFSSSGNYKNIKEILAKSKRIFLRFFFNCLKHLCFIRILQVPAAYSPIDPDAPPTISTYFMKKSNLQYILVENDKINVSVHASTGSIKEQFKCVDTQIEFCFNKLGWSAFVFSWQKVVIQKRTSLKSEVQNPSSLFKKKVHSFLLHCCSGSLVGH